MKYRDRTEAGIKLAAELSDYENRKDTVVVAIPRGGVITGQIIAQRLNLPLELALVKKIGHPTNPEYAIGAVSLNNVTLSKNESISETYIDEQVAAIRTVLKKRSNLFYGKRKPIDLEGKQIIVVDDGVATGLTLVASIDLLRMEKPAKIIVAVPVGPPDTIEKLTAYADEVICLQMPAGFYAIGNYYDFFDQISDEEAIEKFQFQKKKPEYILFN